MSNPKQKSYFRDLPGIEEVKNIAIRICECEHLDENGNVVINEDLYTDLLSVYSQGFKPGRTKFQALEDLNEYVLENGIIEEGDIYSKDIANKLDYFSKDVERAHNKKPGRKAKPKSSKPASKEKQDKESQADPESKPAQDVKEENPSRFESFRLKLGRIFGPSDK